MLPASGSIVNVSSTYGHTGAAGASHTGEQAALEGLTVGCAQGAASGYESTHGRPVNRLSINRFAGTAEKAGLAATCLSIEWEG